LVSGLAELALLGVAFIRLRDNLDLGTPSGRLMFQIIGAMSEFERALIQEWVRAGLRKPRAKGRRLPGRIGRLSLAVSASAPEHVYAITAITNSNGVSTFAWRHLARWRL